MPLTFTDEQYPLFRNTFDARPIVATVALETIDIQTHARASAGRSWKLGVEIRTLPTRSRRYSLIRSATDFQMSTGMVCVVF